jgi:hypothetical protein
LRGVALHLAGVSAGVPAGLAAGNDEGLEGVACPPASADTNTSGTTTPNIRIIPPSFAADSKQSPGEWLPRALILTRNS